MKPLPNHFDKKEEPVNMVAVMYLHSPIAQREAALKQAQDQQETIDYLRLSIYCIIALALLAIGLSVLDLTTGGMN